jgi:hypothetical protein
MLRHDADQTARLKEEFIAAGVPKDEAARRYEEVRVQTEHAMDELLGPERADVVHRVMDDLKKQPFPE